MQRLASGHAVGVLLVAVHVLLASAVAVAFVILSRFSAADEWLFAALIGTSTSQAGLIGLWSGLADAPVRRRMWMTVSGGIALCTLLAVTFRIATPSGASEAWIVAAVFSMAPLAAIGIFAGMLKWRGFRIDQPGCDDEGLNRRIQFSLAHLFAITLVAAILFAFVRGVRGMPPGENPFAPIRIALIATFNALVFVLHTQICLWAALGDGRPVARLGATLASTAIAAGIYGFAVGDRGTDYEISLEMMAIYSLLTCASLWMLRRIGYRLSRLAPEVAGQSL
ncbi:MAG TPA: hypothetical protein VN699_01970, partial [Pirellulales bacterium]|nr:hypothetical protein [Pirellulales bacterium]